MCLLSNDIYDYHYVSQGKVTVPSIDDKEDMQFCHVSIKMRDHKVVVNHLPTALNDYPQYRSGPSLERVST